MIEIDGSSGEGGGQILRSALCMAGILQKEVRIFNIRAGRPEPGLKAQHLTGAKAIATMCNASINGLEIGSAELAFRPGRIRGGSFQFDVGTAGSITLVLQALMPLFQFAPEQTNVEINGGTDVKWSPPIDYLRLVTLPILERMGFAMSLTVVKRGHYPKGGGMVKVISHPSGPLKPLDGQEPGRVNAIDGVSHAVKLPRHVAERQAADATKIICAKGLPRPTTEIEFSENSSHLGAGSGIVLRARTENSAIIGGDSLGERGVPAEEVGRNCALVLVEEIESQTFLDRHMGDIVVPYLALAAGVSNVSVSRITQHVLTNIAVAEKVAGVQFDHVGDVGKPGSLRVTGIGLRPS